MKKIEALTLSALTLAMSSGFAHAMEYDFTMNGYIKAGIIANTDGNRVDSVGLMPDGKWRLGNEQNTKIELLPTVHLKADNGAIARVRANITHETTCTADWNCEDGDNKDVQFREGYAELSNLDFAPDILFWAGKRYSSSNYSSHQYDWEFIQYNGTGGGFDNLDLGFARLDAGIYAFTPSSEGSQPPADISQQGYPEDYSINLWLKGIADTDLDLQFVAHHMNNNVNRIGAAESGIGLTGVYTLHNFYGVSEGFSKLVFQYGEGLASGDSLGKNGWGWANLDDTKSWRVALDGVASKGNWDFATFAFYQSDENYRWWSNSSNGWDRTRWAAGIRPYQQITNNFAMQYEFGYEYLNDENFMGQNGNGKGGLAKLTIAPTLTLQSGYWGRPQIRFFVTYAAWDESVSDALDANYDWGSNAIMPGNYTASGKTDTLNFGIQAEVWF